VIAILEQYGNREGRSGLGGTGLLHQHEALLQMTSLRTTNQKDNYGWSLAEEEDIFPC
jgi:hypothetical protein